MGKGRQHLRVRRRDAGEALIVMCVSVCPRPDSGSHGGTPEAPEDEDDDESPERQRVGQRRPSLQHRSDARTTGFLQTAAALHEFGSVWCYCQTREAPEGVKGTRSPVTES